MIHKIKALYEEGNGLKIQAIARELGISKQPVKVPVVDRSHLDRTAAFDSSAVGQDHKLAQCPTGLSYSGG